MDMKRFFTNENEKPLDNIVNDGGFCKIFRTIGCIGDSLSSGEFESTNDDGSRGYHDFYEYSWGQYIAREAGCKVFNFSCGGMTAKWFVDDFGERCGCWKEENRCQAYIIALGLNDIVFSNMELGSISDVDVDNPENNKETFAGYYGKIIQRLKKLQPKAKIFLMTFPKDGVNAEKYPMTKLLYDFQKTFDNIYILDIEKYGVSYDSEFRKNFFLNGHMNPAGYIFTAKVVMSYIDYIVRNNFEDFSEVGFIGTPYHK